MPILIVSYELKDHYRSHLHYRPPWYF
ncbi:hypothetical protein F383_35560 [Gossypium arboreum]|uniref:Uncharacterized protein n=1 Tax=Gossypium arboreum TaxID=29729 RepID=A0A0B0PXX3_GOSAR|nr:hypothetical protein F383_35560 [Gossypium arboreum]